MKKNTQKPKTLNYINENVAGIDIGHGSIFVSINPRGKESETRRFGTFTSDLKDMVEWLKENNIESAAMESTGVYWIPTYDLLDQAGIVPVLVNAYFFKSLPGKKTDVKDSEWIQQLHSFGLLRGSFRPNGNEVTLRTYVRQRSNQVRQASRQINLIHKVLAQMNIKLNLVISDVTGETGINIIKAIIAGETDPKKLAQFRNYRCRSTEAEIAKSLEGNFKPELVFSLKQSFEAYNFFMSQAMTCEENIQEVLDLWQVKNSDNSVTNNSPKKKKGKNSYSFDATSNLKKMLSINITEIPGLGENLATKIISEIGTDISKWPTAKHFSSWLGLCPNNKISGERVLSSRTAPSSNKAAEALRFAAQSLQFSQTALGAFFRRIMIRTGTAKAITATAHKLAVILYHMMKEKVAFIEVGQAVYEENYKRRKMANLQRQAKSLGYELVAQEA